MVETATATAYSSSLEHLLDELRRVDLLLCSLAARQRPATGDIPELRGLYVSEQEVDAILATLIPRNESIPITRDREDSYQTWRTRLQHLDQTIAQATSLSLQKGIELRLHGLMQAFGLSLFDLQVLMICLAPELDLRYERLYAYLQDDVTKKRPTMSLILSLLCTSREESLAARARFGPKAPLTAYHLIHIAEDSAARPTPLLARPLKLEDRIVDYLLGFDHIDHRLLPFVTLASPQPFLEDLILPEGTKERLRMLQGHLQTQQGDRYSSLALIGSDSAAKLAAAAALSQALGCPLLAVDGGQLPAGELPLEVSLRLVTREALLQKAAVYWDGLGALGRDDSATRILWSALARELKRGDILSFIALEEAHALEGPIRPLVPIVVDFALPSFAERLKLWQWHLNGHSSGTSELELGELANKFRLSSSQISDAIALAQGLALVRGDPERHITLEDLYAACRTHSNQQLSSLAHKVRPQYTWADIVLPRDKLNELREICNDAKYQQVVYSQWGYERKHSLSKGLNILFAGPSGTGKTMAAEIIAHELGLDMYKIDLALVVSKYIGETEKNLERIFQEGATSNAILFFDEADALFGKRSEVRDSHDRYANIEIAYLLQRMETYDGIVILATNMRKNLDEAFLRRMHFVVEFPFPDEEHRRQIWERVFPQEVPLGSVIHFDFLAQRLRISGGNIRNIALAAAFLAAADSRVITMEHIIRATKREYQKMGKLLVEADFGPYYELVRGE